LIGLTEQETDALEEAGQFRQFVPHALVLLFATHVLLQKFWPAGHLHTPLTHPRPPVHTKPAPQPPQLLLSVWKLTHWVPHFVYPLVVQLKPQDVPSHVAMPLDGLGQALQDD
jgi:hypothetical protein